MKSTLRTRLHQLDFLFEQAISWPVALQDVIPTSLLKLGADNSARAVKMFGGVQKYMGLGDAGGEPLSDAMRVEVAAKLLHQATKRPELRDELYMQVSCLEMKRCW